MASERSPLLGNQGEATTPQYGESSDELQNERQTTYVTVPPIGPDDLPPPYSPSPHGVPMITCKVCGFMIDISGRRDQHVVKCSSCNEATPIKSAPPGKKYVRCPCQCLLICKSSSQRISCPRNNCKRILNLAPLPANPHPPCVPGMCQVSCAHCRSAFLFNTLTNALARCPHCRKVSSVGPQYARSRGIMYLIGAFLMLALALAVTFSTLNYSKKYKVLYALDAYEVMNKFANLRTVFRRVCNEHKNKPSGSGSLGFAPRYKHYFALQFLNDTFEATESTSNIPVEATNSNADDADDTDVAQEESFNDDENSVIQESVSEVPILSTNATKGQRRKRKKNEDDVRTLAAKTLQDLTNQPDDEDDAYGQYLVKVLKTLNPIQRDYLKMEIQNLIFKIRHQTNDE